MCRHIKDSEQPGAKLILREPKLQVSKESHALEEKVEVDLTTWSMLNSLTCLMLNWTHCPFFS
jgi:hypothetical protein